METIDYQFQFIQIQMPILKDLKIEDITYQKALLVKKNFYYQAIDLEMKWYKDIRQTRVGQGQD